MPEDPQSVSIVVNVNWKTRYDDTNDEGTKLWHRPLQVEVTREDYEDNPNVLFTILNAPVLGTRGQL